MDELRAVLGHELGHYSGAHTRLGAPTGRSRWPPRSARRGTSGSGPAATSARCAPTRGTGAARWRRSWGRWARTST
ncbi:M48 family metalloprotease [Nonomuraea fuscirosea]|uniref:M48 family metalloprotease n=1 Tax=Nonomuraea fuscirosea TaxID=1291556 RepID=UPI00341F9859